MKSKGPPNPMSREGERSIVIGGSAVGNAFGYGSNVINIRGDNYGAQVGQTHPVPGISCCQLLSAGQLPRPRREPIGPDRTSPYGYDDNGLRVSETTASETKEYVFDTRNPTGVAQVLEEYLNDQLTKVFQIGHNVVTQTDVTDPQAQQLLTLLADGHVSTRGRLDALGTLVQQYAYDAYGNMLSGTGLTTAATALTSILYSGEWTMQSGQQYLRAHIAKPATHREACCRRFTSFIPI